MIFPLFITIKRVFYHHGIKKLAEIICYTKYFCNFVLGKYDGIIVYNLMSKNHELTISSVNFEIIKRL